MKKINPVFIMMGPMMVLVSCAQPKTAVMAQPATQPAISVAAGRKLFLKNCAHCHSADAHGDEGPDLHHFDWTAEQITVRIRNGKAGQMTAFAGKLPPPEIASVVAYVQMLK